MPPESSVRRLGDEEYHIACQIARRHLTGLHRAQPGWTMGHLLLELGFPDTPALRKMAAEAGFTEAAGEDAETKIIVALLERGIWSAEVISDETGFSRHRVTAVLERISVYGSGSYGTSPYGAHNRKVSTVEAPARRRVSIVGQMCYRRFTYNLGTQYRGRIAYITEADHELIVAFGDRPSLRLAARHGIRHEIRPDHLVPPT